MGKMRIEWSTVSKARLKEIFDYHLSVAGLRTANKILGKIDSRIFRILPHSPRAGEREWSLEDEPQGFRRLVEGNYKIVYCVEDDIVKIVDIWDCRRDPVALRDSVAKPATTK